MSYLGNIVPERSNEWWDGCGSKSGDTMSFSNTPRAETLKSLADVKLTPFWLDDPNKPEPVSALTEKITADLVIVGAGFTGLWTALQAKQADPNSDVVLLEAGETAIGASGRNGGFCAASLTH